MTSTDGVPDSQRAFTVSAPATSANLGPGFDCLGLALDLRNVVDVMPGTGLVTVSGEGDGSLPLDGSNAVARAFDLVAPDIREAWDLHCMNAIPLARGLGSSTAATAVGALAGLVASGSAVDRARVFEVAAAEDGHADNAAPCVFGGLQVAGGDTGGWRHRALRRPAGLEPVVWIPARHVPTAAARSVLPATLDHPVAARAVGTAALLVAALVDDDLDAVFELVQHDALHEPFRAGLVPELEAARDALRSFGCAATLSGAGPTVLAWARTGERDMVVATLRKLAGADDVVRPLDITVQGASADQRP